MFRGVERKFLVELAQQAGSNRISTEEIAAKIKCNPNTIYKKLRESEDFREAVKETLQGSLLADAPLVMRSLVGCAVEGSFKHTQLFLEMAGLFQRKQEVEAKISMNMETPFKDSKEAAEFLRATTGLEVANDD